VGEKIGVGARFPNAVPASRRIVTPGRTISGNIAFG